MKNNTIFFLIMGIICQGCSSYLLSERDHESSVKYERSPEPVKTCESGNFVLCFEHGIENEKLGKKMEAEKFYQKACDGNYRFACTVINEIKSGTYLKAERDLTRKILGLILAGLEKSLDKNHFKIISEDSDPLGGCNVFLVQGCYTTPINDLLDEKDPGLVRVGRSFFEINKTSQKLSISSSLINGFIIDRGNLAYKYFEEDGGGWGKLYKENPGAAGLYSISMPAYDKKSGYVLVYIGESFDNLIGSGWMIIYKLKNDKLKEIKRVQIWMS